MRLGVLLGVVASISALPNQVFVSPQGSDDAGDGSSSTPFQTIGFALHSVETDANVTVEVHILQGRYTGANNTFVLSSFKGSVHLVGDSNGRSVVDLSGAFNPFITVHQDYNSASLAVTDLTVMNGLFSGIVISSPFSFISLERVTFNDNAALPALHVTVDVVRVAVIDCVFRNNSANVGGAIRSLGAILILNCEFFNNSAFSRGGAIALIGTAPSSSVVGSFFQANSAPLGGGLYVQQQTTIQSCTFIENSAPPAKGMLQLDGAGAGIFVGSAVLIEGCSFLNNTAEYGAGVSLEFASTINDCNFTSNSANKFGGSVFLGSGTEDVTRVSSCSFSDSVSAVAGGVFVGSTALLQSCHFENNLGLQRDGGAVSTTEGGTTPYFVDCTFHSNSVGKLWSGGAMALSSPAVLIRCNFTQNFAFRGGALWVNRLLKRPLIQQSLFASNFASLSGGALELTSGVTANDTVFINNVASEGRGGAIIIGGGVIVTPLFVGCHFSSNKVPATTGNGGAIYTVSPVKIESCVFEGNGSPKAGQGMNAGGGIAFVNFGHDHGTSMISNSTFHRNLARSFGGGLIVSGAHCYIVGCTFANNSAITGGSVTVFGENQAAGSFVVIDNTQFSDNQAEAAAAALAVDGVAVLTNSVFSNNRAAAPFSSGGAIFIIQGSQVDVTACIFVGNSAATGGAVSLNADAVFRGCYFADNGATTGGAIFVSALLQTEFIGCTFAGNAAQTGSAVFLHEHSHVALQSSAICDDLQPSIECINGTAVVVDGFSSALPSQDVIASCAIVRASLPTFPVTVIAPSQQRYFGAVCGAGMQTQVVVATASPNDTSPVVALSLNLVADKGLLLEASSPAPSAPTSVVPTQVGIVRASDAMLEISNLRDGTCSAGCSPYFGVAVESPPTSQRFTAFSFILLAHKISVSLSLDRSHVRVVGLPFGWARLQTLVLIQLRDQLGKPVHKKVHVFANGDQLLCEGGRASVHLCSVTFDEEGQHSLTLVDASNNQLIGTLDSKVTVVSLGWPIAFGLILVLCCIAALSWASVRAWRKHRKSTADKLLANYVQLHSNPVEEGSAASADPSEEVLMLERSFLIRFDDLDIRRELSAGAHGKVSLATWKDTPVAVKRLYATDRERTGFVKELTVHKGLRHPNVVQLLGVSVKPLCMVMEFMERGTLMGCLTEHEAVKMPWALRLRCALDVARGMSFLHAEGILHRDLKSLNVLINSDWRCKVADFDQSRADADTLTATVGTTLWSAPEVLEGKGEYGKAADVYSFGIVMWECWTRDPPYHQPDTGGPRGYQVRQLVLQGHRPVCSPQHGEPPQQYARLMQRCWSTHPEQRPAFRTVVEELETGSGAMLDVGGTQALQDRDDTGRRSTDAEGRKGRHGSRPTSEGGGSMKEQQGRGEIRTGRHSAEDRRRWNNPFRISRHASNQDDLGSPLLPVTELHN